MPPRPPTLRSLDAQVGDTLRRSNLTGPEAGNVRALLLAGLISYREANAITGGLGHVTVLEEAHRVLRDSTQESEGVRLFVEAIAELRGSGEGFVIVDQAPTLLHPGVLELSGWVLTHRLIDPHERAIVGAAVLLDERQQQDLARLELGQAVLFSSRRAISVVVDVDAGDAAHGELFALPTQAAHAAARDGARRSLVADGGIELPHCIGCRQMCLRVERARRPIAAHPPTLAEPQPVRVLPAQGVTSRPHRRTVLRRATFLAWIL